MAALPCPAATTAADSPPPQYALYTACFDLPTVHEMVRVDGEQQFGPVVEFDEMSDAQLTEYEAELLLVEAHVNKELEYARRKIADARRALGEAA